ncbi:MAG: S8 family serine peptidase [candidate division Zixibacteria bacterium]|nr:S8 family serine peptidase [candidate division Zixibacteria bacterium]
MLSCLFVFNYAVAQEPDFEFQPGRIIIKTTQELNLKILSNTGSTLLDSLNTYYGVSNIEQLFNSTGKNSQQLQIYNQLGMGRVYFLTLPDTTDILQAVDAYQNLIDIEFAEPNVYYKPMDVYPCDELFEHGWQWGLYNRDSLIQPGCKYRADIKAPEAWGIEKGDTNLIVAIIDSGIRRNADETGELKDKVWVNWEERNGIPGVDDDNNGYTDDSIGWNFVFNTPFVEPLPTSQCADCLHGSHIAKIIGSETDSTNYCMESAGINWGCRLMNCRVDTCYWYNGFCDYGDMRFPSAAIALAIDYAVTNGAKVINMSFCFLIIETQMYPLNVRAVETAIKNAYLNGVVSIAAMGNGEDEFYDPKIGCHPAHSEYALAVGATDCVDNRVIHPPYWQSSFGPHLDIVAPGNDILTFYNEYFGGTSASCAFGSGVASLVMTHRKKLMPAETLTTDMIYEVIRHTADDTVGNTYSWGELEDTPCWDQYYGWGRANAFKALVSVSHGDADNSSQISIADINYLIAHIFQGGPPPVPVLEMGDANCDGSVTLSDAVYLINYLFKGGTRPPLCYNDCSEF